LFAKAAVAKVIARIDASSRSSRFSSTTISADASANAGVEYWRSFFSYGSMIAPAAF
jgi:hypothetical protein